MIELKQDRLVFSFPEVHPEASLTMTFQRTLRISDDDKTYPLPPGLGAFPLRHVDDFAANIPALWREHGGVMMPMWQSEAMWLLFSAWSDAERWAAYPFAIKVAAGKIDAVSGKSWSPDLQRRPQNYMVAPTQPWLDGFCVDEGLIRQFVAMPLGAGYSAEEQITGAAEHGGVQIVVYPMKREAFERRFPKIESGILRRKRGMRGFEDAFLCACAPAGADMALAPGGRMKQEIYNDPFDLDDWDTAHSSRCFVHIANSLSWRAITGEAPPTVPPTAKQYSKAGLPWFDYYDDRAVALKDAGVLSKLKSVMGIAKQKGEQPLPENEPCEPKAPVVLIPARRKHEVREGTF
jgi:hypothetical protein